MNVMKTSSDSYYPHFDWLRCVLAMTVVASHANLLGWGNAGPFAVHVFFVLSGWLIGGILLDLRSFELPRFFYNRTLRIWVPYFIALGLLVIVSLSKDAVTPKWLEFVLYKSMMVFNIFGSPQRANYLQEMPLDGTGFHLWSVNAEEQFYLVVPLLLVLLTWRGLGQSRVLWFSISLCMWAMGSEYAGLSFGVLAKISLREKEQHLKTVGRWVAGIVLLASLVPLVNDTTYIYAAPITGLMIVLLLAQWGKASRVGAVVGGMSYSLYLNHWLGVFAANFVAKKLDFVTAGDMLWSIVALGIPTLLAVMHYQFIDLKIQKTRSRYYTSFRGNMATTAAYLLMAAGLTYGLLMWR